LQVIVTLDVKDKNRKGNSIEQRDGSPEVFDGHSPQILRTISNSIERHRAIFGLVHQGQQFQGMNITNSTEKGKNNNLASVCVLASAKELFRTALNNIWSGSIRQ